MDRETIKVHREGPEKPLRRSHTCPEFVEFPSVDEGDYLDDSRFLHLKIPRVRIAIQSIVSRRVKLNRTIINSFYPFADGDSANKIELRTPLFRVLIAQLCECRIRPVWENAGRRVLLSTTPATWGPR
jgi:hypothetical protein